MLVVDLVVEVEHPPACGATRQYLGMQVGEIACERVAEHRRHADVIRAGKLHASGVITLRAVEVMPRLQRLDGVEHGDVRHRAPLGLQQVVQPGEEAVECGQRLVIERVSVGEFGQERHVCVVIPYGMGDKLVDAFGILLHCDGIEFPDGDVAHRPECFRHDQPLVPVGCR